MNKEERVILAAILGAKKLAILEFLLSSKDEHGFINVKISDICKQLEVSKPTVLNTFKMLESKQIFERVKNGVYRFKV